LFKGLNIFIFSILSDIGREIWVKYGNTEEAGALLVPIKAVTPQQGRLKPSARSRSG